ncbi:MAG TPA: ATP-dependent DNA helicase RecQ [Saprospiraceae bacterium]|nr:ATP-dependent DNA helicase RecQ [Saprospiraceae bacterium]MCB9329386.1 ATP-dependent DNA helicase RecQ [Lewinellaceae bacterium]HPK08825.1 ATP-dependent DNA helicase RecQ [Saprospiraceae bacterium]HRX28825.1 ATP-dependent DNA helicase RecQ [Saprospiraceae bacterium]
MIQTDFDLRGSLKTYFGFENFKSNQESIIESIINGKDTFVIMPTGGGKSLCYQLPAILLPGTALIISPLIALMKNQVDSIRGYSQMDNIAHFLNSSLNKSQMREVKADIRAGKTKMLFVAPETLTKDENIEFFKNTDISFVAVDEAHCISEWGHDFRPEYRRIRDMISAIGTNIPIIALTATATPKVQSDIVKNLEMKTVNTFISSFNRDNLFYEIRSKKSKDQTIKEIIQFIKLLPARSGIIYVQARKTTEQIAQILNVNGIKSAPYHAGLDAKTRSKVQDDFLMEEIDVIVATIAFGMGIDKPDVRFVIHYDIPKSIENYYQETGRAGRDGLEGKCMAFYSYKDILKLEKFLRDKPVAERELSAQLMDEIIAYTETSTCRRQFLLHYFGEPFNDENCDKMCDNCKHPKDKEEVSTEMQNALKVIEQLNENYTIKTLVDFTIGKNSKEMKDFKFDRLSLFGVGKEKDELFWHSIFRQAILHNLIYKEIEQYGLLKLTDAGRAFIKKKYPIEIPLNRDFSDATDDDDEIITGAGGAGAALDELLMGMLMDLRKREAKKLNVQPWIIFQEPALQDMATYYPISNDEMDKISGVNKTKAIKYGKPFLELIREYVEENEIERPTEIVIRQVANKSKNKVAIIQAIDRKMPLGDIAKQVEMNMESLLEELNIIVDSGTKLDINYCIDDHVDSETVEEIFDYFHEASDSDYEKAFLELREDDISRDEVMLVRVKFITEVVN